MAPPRINPIDAPGLVDAFADFWAQHSDQLPSGTKNSFTGLSSLSASDADSAVNNILATLSQSNAYPATVTNDQQKSRLLAGAHGLAADYIAKTGLKPADAAQYLYLAKVANGEGTPLEQPATPAPAQPVPSSPAPAVAKPAQDRSAAPPARDPPAATPPGSGGAAHTDTSHAAVPTVGHQPPHARRANGIGGRPGNHRAAIKGDPLEALTRQQGFGSEYAGFNKALKDVNEHPENFTAAEVQNIRAAASEIDAVRRDYEHGKIGPHEAGQVGATASLALAVFHQQRGITPTNSLPQAESPATSTVATGAGATVHASNKPTSKVMRPA